MTLYPAIVGTFQPHKRYLPRWIYHRETPLLTSEGGEVVLSMFVNNFVVGSQILHWMTGGNSLASAGNWEQSWHDVFAAELARNGCTYRRLSGSTIPAGQGTLSGLITIGEGYAGQLMRFVNRSRRNRRTNATNPDGSPGYREMQILLTNQGDAGTPERERNGTGQILGGNLVRVLDTSRTPTGTPSLRLRLPDGATVLLEGDTLRIRIETANIVPRTKLKLYPAEDGRKALRPTFRNELRRAGEAAGCSVFLPRFDPGNPGAYYDGGEITFTETYSDDRPIEMVFAIPTNADEEKTRDLHVISILTAEGDASEFDAIRLRGDWASDTAYRRGDWVVYLNDGGRYIYTAESTTSGHAPTDTAYWRPYVTTQTSSLNLTLQIKDVPPRFWELRATVADGSITYAVQVPISAAGDSVALASIDAPAGFAAALTAAASGGAAAVLAGGRLVAQAGGSLTFSVPFAGAGKHVLRLSDPHGPSPIVIADACVYLTAPVLPSEPAKRIGVNLAGGEFGEVYRDGVPGGYGTDYAYPSQPEHNDPAKRHQELDYWRNLGTTIVRVPVKWERIQPVLFGPLYGEGAGGWNGRQDIRRLDELIDHAESIGLTVILDVHNYASYKFADGTSGKVAYDSATVPTAALADLWERLAQRYANRPVWFDLMNEPSGSQQTARRVADWAQAVLNAIRARTPALNRVLVEGQRYSSAQYWVSEGQAAAFGSFYDPAGNFAFSPHSYPDAEAAGANGVCVVGTARLTAIGEWATANGRDLFLGEVAGGDPAVAGQDGCATIMPAIYSSLRDHPRWRGGTAWGGGRRWYSSYHYRLDPANYQSNVTTGCAQLLLPYLS